MPEILREGGGRPKKLLTLVREAIRGRHISGRTEESYVSRIKPLLKTRKIASKMSCKEWARSLFGSFEAGKRILR